MQMEQLHLQEESQRIKQNNKALF